jgi:thiamine biosynthesis lipoprotein
VSVAAASCLDANTASTAAVLLGEAAPEWLSERRFPARLVSVDEDVVTVGGWPAETVMAA